MLSSKPVTLKTLLLALLVLTTAIGVSYGQSKNQKIDELISLYHDYGKFNGSALVADQGKVIYKKGHGMANMEWDIPNNPDTKHRLGSITKQFTAMLILQLAADGKLDLHKPISTYLPDYPKKTGEIITTHHLLTHSSGIPNYTSFPGFMQNETRNPYSPEEFVGKFADKDLDFPPGDRFSYSNSGYFLLGVIIEKLTGKTYEQMLDENILIPLNMYDTGYDNHGEIMKKRATGYEKNGTTVENSRYLDMSIPYAAGSMYSTVEDLYKWDQALYTDKLLPKKYMELYFAPHIPSGNLSYAYGWGVGKTAIGSSTDSMEIISHSGGINGFHTLIVRSPETKSLVVLLNNTGGTVLNQIASSIAAILHEKPYNIPKKSLAFDVLDVINEQGIQAGMTYFNAKKDGEEYELIENEMNAIGYELMNSGKTDEAAQIFKLNLDAFPASFNVYDSYAEALMNQGKTEMAIENYKKSIEINPGNQNGIDMLKKLGVDTGDLAKDFEVDEGVLESYVGKYELMPGFILTVTKDGKQMKAQATGQPVFDIFPKSENEFYLKVITARLTFNKGEGDTIESVTLFQGGQELVGKRMAD